MVEHLGIKFTGFGDDFLQARMPVDHRTMQPSIWATARQRFLRSGETMGSIASFLCIEDATASSGWRRDQHQPPALKGLSGKVSPCALVRKLHVWNIEIKTKRTPDMCQQDNNCCGVEKMKQRGNKRIYICVPGNQPQSSLLTIKSKYRFPVMKTIFICFSRQYANSRTIEHDPFIAGRLQPKPE